MGFYWRKPLKLNGRPLIVAYGKGVDSTSILIGFARRGIKPDLVIFSDTGGEKQETYDYGPVMDAFLERNGMPKVTTVAYRVKDFKNWPPYYTLEENCLTNGTLPSLAFGFKSCSIKWKATPQDKYCKVWRLAVDAWARGERVVKVIGYDAGPTDGRRIRHFTRCVERYTAADGKRKERTCHNFTPESGGPTVVPCPKCGRDVKVLYDYWYPLVEWGWNRERCKEEIAKEGLPVPPKSSCFFCPAMKPWEVDELPKDKLRRIVVMEARAFPRQTQVEGLWRRATKKRPGSMREYIRQKGLLPAHEIDRLEADVPKEIIRTQELYAKGEEVASWNEFFEDLPAFCCGAEEEVA